jgi:8-oxo-dGTP diphosphatase
MTHSPDKDFYAALPAKRMASGALYLNHRGELLIVAPTYRKGWLIPGGVIERNESPYQACLREVKEELGLELPVHRLLCAEYRTAEGVKTESIQFIFYGGELSDETAARLTPQPGEIAAICFYPREEALGLINGPLAHCITVAFQALNQNRLIYLENRVEIL